MASLLQNYTNVSETSLHSYHNTTDTSLPVSYLNTTDTELYQYPNPTDTSLVNYPNTTDTSLYNHTNTTDNNGTGAVNTPEMILVTDGVVFQMMHEKLMAIRLYPLILICVYALAGSIGNAIVLYIYGFKWKKTKTRVFILCLGMIDFLNCVFNMPVEILVLSAPISFDHHLLCKISRGSTFVFNNTGALVFVAIAIDRCMVVYRPIKSRQWTPKYAKIMCFIAFLISSAFSWPSYVFYGSATLTIPIPNTNFVVRGKTCLIADEHEFRTGLILIFTSVLFALLIIVFAILTVLYIAIGRKIYMATCTDIETGPSNQTTKLLSKSIISAITGITKPVDDCSSTENGSMNKRASMSELRTSMPCVRYEPSITAYESSETDVDLRRSRGSLPMTPNGIRARQSRRFSTVRNKATMKNTVMMRVVTIAFMMSFTPFLVILVIRYTNPLYYFSLDKNSKIVYDVFLRSYFINSMVNPFIYGFMNIQFRKLVIDLFKSIFCSKCCRRK